MRIAMLGHKTIPGRSGGIEVVVEELSTRMAQLGHIVTVYNRSRRQFKKSPKEYSGVKLVTIPTIEKKNTDAIIYAFLASIRVLFGNFDIIHYHGIGPSLMLLIPHIFGKRCIVTVHGLNWKTQKWKGFGRLIMHLGERVAARYADQIIVLSKDQLGYFKEKYQRDTIYIPNGTSPDNIFEPDEIKTKWELSKGGYILFVSRLVPGKGLEYIIQAYKETDIELPLIIVGESLYVDNFYSDIKRMANSDKRIRFIGFVSGKPLAELYANTALFVFPSEAEGMPLCLMEALSYNAPCLVSDIPENIALGHDYVQTFKCCDIEDLSLQMLRCLRDKKVLYTKESRGYIAEYYDWNYIVKMTLNSYER